VGNKPDSVCRIIHLGALSPQPSSDLLVAEPKKLMIATYLASDRVCITLPFLEAGRLTKSPFSACLLRAVYFLLHFP
jgi:hypothetical protein